MLELTAACNARCPACARTQHFIKEGKSIKGSTNISMEVIENIFSLPWPNLRQINVDGNYGDSLFHPQSLDILNKIIELHPNHANVKLFISTNGGFFNEEFWTNLAGIFKQFHPDSAIEFGIDGIDAETHARYRVNTDLNKVLKNAQAFINAGGRAEWKWIGFEWNDHQLEDAKKLAEQMGFDSFRFKNTRVRQTVIRQLLDKDFQAPQHKSNIASNISKTIAEDAAKEVSAVKDFANECVIKCKFRGADKKKYGFQVEHNGRVWQCCHLSGVYNYQTPGGKTYKEYEYYINKYKEGWNDLNIHSIQEVLTHRYFSHDLEESWSNRTDSVENPRINRCIAKCGSIDNV